MATARSRSSRELRRRRDRSGRCRTSSVRSRRCSTTNSAGVSAAALARVSDLCEQPFVLAEHDIPAVTATHILAAIAAERLAQPLIADKKLQRFDELVAIGVVKAGVAAHAVLDEHCASCIDENG